MPLSTLRPLNRAVKYQASVQSSDAGALRLATPSKLMRTTLRTLRFSPVPQERWSPCCLQTKPQVHNFAVQSKSAIVVKLSQLLAWTVKCFTLPVQSVRKIILLQSGVN